jgi:hypothetical protein
MAFVDTTTKIFVEKFPRAILLGTNYGGTQVFRLLGWARFDEIDG